VKMTKAQLAEARRSGQVSPVKQVPTEGNKVPQEGVISPPKEVVPEEKPHASMSASIAAYENQAEATRVVISSNTSAIDKFREELQEKAKRHHERKPWDFFIHRDSDGLLERVRAEPVE